jgi:hypothetical protein
VIIPLVQFIYNGVMWDKANMSESNIEVWIMTYILINALTIFAILVYMV